MADIEYPFNLRPSAYGTRMSFSCSEDGGHFVVEANVHNGGNTWTNRAHISFSGFVKARINEFDKELKRSDYMLGKIVGSGWKKEFLDAYIEEFGSNLFPVVANVEHFFVIGHDSQIEVLARHVEVSFETIPT